MKHCSFIEHLNLSKNSEITDKGLLPFIHSLTSLNLSENSMISENMLTQLSSLKNLELRKNTIITNKGIFLRIRYCFSFFLVDSF